MPGTAVQDQLRRSHYRAPAESGQILAIPEFTESIQRAAVNSEALGEEDVRIANVPLNDLRRQARQEIISEAVRWTNELTGQNLACAECSHHAALLFVTGHQPQLAHAGVWAKNFAVAGMAESSQGLGLNIIVDNDTVGTQAIRVPAGSLEDPRFQDLPFDTAQPQQPWEELTIQNQELFESFAERVNAAMAEWSIRPVLSEMWPDAIAASRKSRSMYEVLSTCRILQERRWGARNLEIPLSRICKGDSFLLFASHLILDVENFHSTYNQIVTEYRAANGIRNNRHPVPNLKTSGAACELPFWFWKQGDLERGQVFAERDGQSVRLFCRDELILEATPETLLAELRALQQRGKFRTRALTTTLFSRMLLADLFIHGIGGAKYDEMTDLLFSRYFGIEPPSFQVLSATLHLPVPMPPITEDTLQELHQKRRDFEFNADRYLSGPAVEELKRRKTELIQQHWEAQPEGLSKRERRLRKPANRQRHLELKQVNAALFELAGPEIEQLKEQIQSVEAALQAKSVLGSREYSSVLFPEDDLSALFGQLLLPV